MRPERDRPRSQHKHPPTPGGRALPGAADLHLVSPGRRPARDDRIRRPPSRRRGGPGRPGDSRGPARERCDMVAGTATGAIIAAGIALGLDAGRILALYRDLAREAFQRLPWWKILLNRGNYRYSNEFVARTIDSIGADVPLNSLPIDILITGKSTETTRTDFFVRDNPGNGCLWGTMRLRAAVRASIAVPTYSPAHSAVVRGEPNTWVDGGVGVAGNPCYHAAVEAIHYTTGLYLPGQTRLLSFGTGRAPHRIAAPRAGIPAWG